MLVIRGADEERVTWRPGTKARLLAGSQLGSEAVCVLEQWHEPGGGAPTHRHRGVEEAVVLLEGEAEFWVESEREGVVGVATVVVPPGLWHGFRNTGKGPLHVLAVFPVADPPVEYAAEPGTVLAIAGEGGVRRDAHRVVRVDSDAR